ncbi:MAG: damage-inducible protein D [Acidobacteriota bacterium]
MTDDRQLAIIFDEDGEAFEHLAKENGKRTWSARKLMSALGYDDWSAFKKVIEKAMASCALLGVQLFDHFSPSRFQNASGREVEDFTLSRWACGMTALNGDSTSRNVAAAQAYFVSLAEMVVGHGVGNAESVDRLVIREEISEREITLAETAERAGAKDHAGFRVAGYVGMYEMDYQEIRRLRNVYDKPRRSVLDFMGKDELAGNLFRLALTEGRIKKDGIRGQEPLERVAKEVGARVRDTMHEQTGFYPEELPTAQDIKEVRKGLKRAGKELLPLDDMDAARKAEQESLSAALPTPSEDAVEGCPECAGGNPAPHYGSQRCTSGSLASGGGVAHCTCDSCF